MAQAVARCCSLVITNHNGRGNLSRFLPAVLRAAAHSDLCEEILLVDDASTDDSVAYVEEHHPEIRIIRMPERSSFLGAANEGFRQARAPYVALLSNDMEPDENLLERLLVRFEDSDVFAVHATVLDPQGAIESERRVGRFVLGNLKMVNAARRDSGLARLLIPEQVRSTFSFFAGGNAVFDRARFLELGGFDPIYFPFYWEDVDLCFRAWKRGWKTIHEPAARVTHHHRECGTILNSFRRSYVRRIERRNRFFFIWSNIDSPRLLLQHVLHVAGSLLLCPLVGRFHFYGSLKDALAMWPMARERRRRREFNVLDDEDIFSLVAGDADRLEDSSEVPRKETAQSRPEPPRLPVAT